jgi:lipoate-protein ligase A
MNAHENWRLIDSGPCSAVYNMALDESIAVHVRKNESPPTLRLYGWDRPSISLGYSQKASDIDRAFCALHNIPVVRRPTGGRAILHGDELTYSFSVSTDHELFSGGLLDSYRKISAALTLAFRKAGIPAESQRKRERGAVLAGSPLCFQSSSFGEILVNNKKVAGSAQKRWHDGLLQQGSIPYKHQAIMMNGIFTPKHTARMSAHMTALREVLPGLNEREFRTVVASAFEETFGVSFLPALPAQREIHLALELESGKYLQDSWNLRL